MRCFYHLDREAIGMCKYCERGLCSDCAADLEYGLACRGKHEADVEALNDFLKTQIRITEREYSPTLIGNLTLFLIGGGLIALGWNANPTMVKFGFIVVFGGLLVTAYRAGFVPDRNDDSEI